MVTNSNHFLLFLLVFPIYNNLGMSQLQSIIRFQPLLSIYEMSNAPKNDNANQPPDSEPIAESDGSLPIYKPLSRVSTGPTIFTSKEKTLIVALGAIGALLSPLTSNIHHPALVDLAHDHGASYNDINLSITVYLIFQGIAPTFTASIADAKSRRPAYILCLTFYLAANIGLSLQNSYAGLMVLRCLQSSGSSGMVTFGNVMVSDIATSSQRGSYIGWASLGVLLGPVIGPIIGGLLNHLSAGGQSSGFPSSFQELFFLYFSSPSQKRAAQ
jgi:hypothetical protein